MFSTSAAVLVLEILAGRILAPYLGVSLEVFTGIIGVILAGISTGAWIGGRLADRSDPNRLPGPLLVFGGLAAVAAPIIVDLVGPEFSPAPIQIVLITALGFFLPAAILSAVAPVVVKIRLASLDETGTVVGSFSAIGTAGAILGTFLTGYFLIAAFPTRPIVYLLGAAITVTGVILTGASWSWSLAVLALLGAFLFLGEPPCQFETTYHCALVVADDDRSSGRTLVLDTVRNSYVDLADPTHLEFRYLRALDDVVSTQLPEGPLQVAHIGGGGFTYPTFLTATRPGTKNTILEIDSKLVDIGVSELGFEQSDAVVVDDARNSLADLAPSSLDLIVGDAFSGFSVPWHLTTTEFIETIQSRLADGGIYVANIIDYPPLGFVRAELAAMQAVFDEVAVFGPPSYLQGTTGGNFVVVGSDRPIAVEDIEARIRARGGSENGFTGRRLAVFIDNARPLRDDFAPVDQLLTQPFRTG